MITRLPAPTAVLYAAQLVLVLLVNVLVAAVLSGVPGVPFVAVAANLGGIFAVVVGMRVAWLHRERPAPVANLAMTWSQSTANARPLARVFADGQRFDAWVSPDLTVVFGAQTPRESWTPVSS
jgi:uncharacterized protein YacL